MSTPSKRIIIPLPNKTVHTRIETYYNGKLNRVGGALPGQDSIKIKLPGDAELEDCLIRVIPDYPNSNGYVYDGEELKPFEPILMDHPAVIGARHYEPLKEVEPEIILDDEADEDEDEDEDDEDEDEDDEDDEDEETQALVDYYEASSEISDESDEDESDEDESDEDESDEDESDEDVTYDV